MHTWVIRVNMTSSPTGVAYLQQILFDEGKMKVLYTTDVHKARQWGSSALAREFKSRDDMPSDLGRVVKVTDKMVKPR